MSSEYIIALDNNFSDIVKSFNQIQLSSRDQKAITVSNELLTQGISLLQIMKQHTRALETLLSDCQDFVKDIEEELYEQPKPEDFVFLTKSGMLSYRSRLINSTNATNPINTTTATTANNSTNATNQPTATTAANQLAAINTKNNTIQSNATLQQNSIIEKTLIPELNCSLKVHSVKSLKTIPPMFNYYRGDSKNPAGLYCCVIPHVYIRVPFPEIVDSTKEIKRNHSIRCMYKTKQICEEQKKKISKQRNTLPQICNFAHEGDKIVKIGYPSRCSKMPNYGNPVTFTNDMKEMDIDAIRNIIMYGINDVAVAAVWMDYNKPNQNDVVFDALDRA